MTLRARLEAFGLHAKKRLGQHFLHDPNALARIARTVEDAQPKALIEIGPGPATLTDHLAELNVPMAGVEKDPDMVRLLRSRFEGVGHVQIVEGDVLQVDLPSLFPGVKAGVVGNIPYNISTPILLHLVGYRTRLGPAVLMMQAELAERLRAPVGTRASGSLTVLLALLADSRRILTLPPQAFTPPPKVRSEVLEISWLSQPRVSVPSVDAFERTVRAGFGQRRKTLRNALRGGLGAGAVERLGSSAIDLDRRAETLSLEEWASITWALEVGND